MGKCRMKLKSRSGERLPRRITMEFAALAMDVMASL
jgi:hypothetical protein